MDQQPKIPTLKDAQKPQVKIKGLGAGLTLFDRLKQFKKKDLAFILAGLGTLFMAPLAEHFLMAPENGDGQLERGWGGVSKGGGNLFGSGSSPYENGNNSIAQGGAIGGAGDIITPLNVRDPSALVMGPGAAQQPPAGSAAPATAPTTASSRSEADYKDALAGAASRAASAAVKKSPLPIPKVALGGNGLRGLGIAGGGTSAAGGLGPINGGATGKAGTGGGGLNLVRATPNFRGAAGPRGPNSPSGLDGTRRAGANAGDAFNRSGNALNGLNAAANEQIPAGGSSFGGGGNGGAGANDRPGGGSGPGGSKSVGESLAFIAAKERITKNIELEFKRKELKDPELLLYAIRNDSLKEIAKGMTGSLTKAVLSFMDPASSSNPDYTCIGGPATLTKSQLTPICDDKQKDSCFRQQGTYFQYINPGGNAGMTCYPSGKSDGDGKPKAVSGASTAGGSLGGMASPETTAATSALADFCTLLDKEIGLQTEAVKNKSDTSADGKLKDANAMRTEVGKMISVRDALYGTVTANSCGATPLRKDKSVYEYQGSAVAKLLEAEAVPGLVKLVVSNDGTVDKAHPLIKEARKMHGDAVALLQEAKNTLSGVNMSVFESKLFNDGGGEFQRLTGNAKKAKPGLDEYAEKEGKLLTPELDNLIKGAEFAGDKDQKPTITQVIEANAAYVAVAKRAEAVGVKPGAVKPAEGETPTAGASTNPKQESIDVVTKVNEAKAKIGTDDNTGARLAVKNMEEGNEAAKKAGKPFTPEERDVNTFNEAFSALGEMQKKQTSVLSAVSGGLTEIMSGKKVATPDAAK